MTDTELDMLRACHGQLLACSPPLRRYRCTKGHEWEVKSWEVAHGMIELHGKSFCTLCLADALAAVCGTVEEVIEAVADTPTVRGDS